MLNLISKFTACAAVLGCTMVLPIAAYARGGGGNGGEGSITAFPSAAGTSAKVGTAATTMIGGIITIGG